MKKKENRIIFFFFYVSVFSFVGILFSNPIVYAAENGGVASINITSDQPSLINKVTEPTGVATASDPITEPTGVATASDPITEPTGVATASDPITEPTGVATASDPITEPTGVATASDPITEPTGVATASDPITEPTGVATASDPITEPTGVATASDPITESTGVATASDPITEPTGSATESVPITEATAPGIESVTLEPSASSDNLAAGKSVSSSATFMDTAYITDGDESNTDAYSRSTPNEGLQWIQIDLGAEYDINEIKLWHYYGDTRQYHDVIIQLSNDVTFTTASTVFNNDADNSAALGIGTDGEYVETREGKVITVNSVMARYVRFYTNGNSVNNNNHYVEVKIHGEGPYAEKTKQFSLTVDNVINCFEDLTNNQDPELFIGFQKTP